MKVPPLAQKTHREINAAVNQALRSDPRIGELIGLARQLETGEGESDQFWDAIAAAGNLLFQTEVGTYLPLAESLRVAYLYATLDFPRGDDGALLPVIGEVKVTGVPGIEGRPLWVLKTPADVATMRDELEPGQVWVRSDLVKSDDWPRVRALASDALERMLGKGRPAGRRTGSANVRRATLVARVRANPKMTRDEIHAEGMDLDLWGDALRDQILIGDRVRRIRRDAAKKA